MKQSNLSEILTSELRVFTTAPKKYGDYFSHALQSYKLLQRFVIKVSNPGWLFVAFLAHIRKHHLLALMSVVRLHHVQAFMNLRQVLESGANASYALVNPNSDDFANITPEDLLEVSDKVKKKIYRWLDQNYPKSSKAIKSMKKMMQQSSHSNIIDVHRTFKYLRRGKHVELKTPFFDLENDFQIKSDLWVIANIAMGLMDLFYGVNLKYKIITFSPNFKKDLQSLEKENKRLKKIMMDSLRFKRADRIAKLREKRKLKHKRT